MENTQEPKVEQPKPFRLKNGSRIELTSEKANFLFQFSQGYLLPMKMMFDLIEEFKNEFVNTGQIDIIDLPPQGTPQMEKIESKNDSKPQGRIVDMFKRPIEDNQKESIPDPLQ